MASGMPQTQSILQRIENGGCFTTIPGSQFWIEEMIKDREFRRRKEADADNRYEESENLPGLDWNPVEVTCKAGDIFFYNPHSIHNASDNHLDAPRVTCTFHYSSIKNVAKEVVQSSVEQRFNLEHLKTADERFKRLAPGLPDSASTSSSH